MQQLKIVFAILFIISSCQSIPTVDESHTALKRCDVLEGQARVKCSLANCEKCEAIASAEVRITEVGSNRLDSTHVKYTYKACWVNGSAELGCFTYEQTFEDKSVWQSIKDTTGPMIATAGVAIIVGFAGGWAAHPAIVPILFLLHGIFL